jgi:hypothetical protein
VWRSLKPRRRKVLRLRNDPADDRRLRGDYILTLKPAASNAIVAWKIPVTGERAGDGAAMYLCLLAYPGDASKCYDAFDATLAYRERSWREHNRVTGRAVRGEVPEQRAQALLSRWPVRDMWGTLDMLNKQLLNRLRAAELFAYFGVVVFVKPTRHRQVGRYRVAARPAAQSLIANEEGGYQVMRLIDDPFPSLYPMSHSDLVVIGAERWNTEPGNVRKNILNPVKPVAHLAIALREFVLARRALALSTPDNDQTDDDLLTCLLSRPQWVLPAIEDSQIVARDWHANASSRPSWQLIDPTRFIELQPTVD